MRRFVWILLALALAAPAPALAEEALRPGGEALVKAVVDGDTVLLESAVMGAQQIRLVGIQAPKLPLGRKNFPTWPLAEESKKALQSLTLGKTVRLSFGGSDKDRYGRLLAHLHRPDGTWVQGEMLKKGMARVYSFPDNRALVGPMLALEAEARAARRGIWGLRFYAVRTPQELSSWIGTFQLVEGKVLKAARVKGRVYLNFGDDWKTDFTITIGAPVRRMFRKAGTDPLSLEGKRIRVRGWLKRYNGPMIKATHPEQIEILGKTRGGDGGTPDRETTSKGGALPGQ